jgi:hypothetical protein
MPLAERRGMAERDFITHFWIGSTFSRVHLLKKSR